MKFTFFTTTNNILELNIKFARPSLKICEMQQPNGCYCPWYSDWEKIIIKPTEDFHQKIFDFWKVESENKDESKTYPLGTCLLEVEDEKFTLLECKITHILEDNIELSYNSVKYENNKKAL